VERWRRARQRNNRLIVSTIVEDSFAASRRMDRRHRDGALSCGFDPGVSQARSTRSAVALLPMGGGGARTLIDQGPCGDKAKPFPELERARAARRKALGRTD
jgi:hypothetical protein